MRPENGTEKCLSILIARAREQLYKCESKLSVYVGSSNPYDPQLAGKNCVIEAQRILELASEVAGSKP